MSIKNGALIAARENLKKYEKTVDTGLLSFVEAGKALGMIRLEKLYALAGFAEFDAYVEHRFSISPRHADRLISAARVVLLLGPIGRLINNESTARELAVFSRDEADKMRAVVEAATVDGRVTAARVRTARDEMYPEYRTIDGEFREGGQHEIEAAPEEETSAAGPAVTTGGAFPPAGEPVDVDEQASTGTQTAAEDADTTEADAGPARPVAPTEAATAPESVGDQNQERIEEEAAEPPADLPAAATTSLPDGDGDPMPEQSQQPGQDSPPVLGSEGFPGRAETDHQQVAGVSPAGVAPGSGSGPQYADPVEPVELEDGDAAVTPSSSDLDVAGNPAERLLLAVAGLVHYLDQLDADAVGPLLDGPDVEQLLSHAEEISAHITRIGRARFAEMLHTQ